MRFDPQKIINSRFGVGLALALGRAMPPRLGSRLASLLAGWISNHRSWSLVRAVRLNQWIVSGESLSGAALDQAVSDTFQHTARCQFDLYRHLRDPAASQLVNLDGYILQLIKASGEYTEPCVLVGIHLSNFDFVMQAAFQLGLKALALGVSHPAGGYEWQNDIRRQHGVELVPSNKSTMRLALERLEAGGIVMAGIDRPIPDPKYRPCFFGRPAALPVAHVILALKANAPVRVVASIQGSDGKYGIMLSEPLWMESHPERNVELLQNAEMVLRVAEGFIRQAPRQWAMFYPVWPEVKAEVS